MTFGAGKAGRILGWPGPLLARCADGLILALTTVSGKWKLISSRLALPRSGQYSVAAGNYLL